MIAAKAYAAQSPEADLAPWDFERREVGPHDVQFEILYCGVCHSDLHQIKNDWFPGNIPYGARPRDCRACDSRWAIT
jgi:uncharacterized zinc-type alcohol dehydrogenase-like protein